MRNPDEEVKELAEVTARTRCGFVRAELQACFTWVDMGKHELSAGNTEFARKAAALAERGIQEIKRFPGQTAGEPRLEIEEKLAQVIRANEELKRAIGERA